MIHGPKDEQYQCGHQGACGHQGPQGSPAPKPPKAIQDLPPRPPGRNTKCSCGCGKKVKRCPNNADR
jgi:hypothetical protein